MDNSESVILFTQQDLDLFSKASGDRNPLHLSPSYARQTSYGQCVVFGCLGAIACLGGTSLPEDLKITSLEASFLRPIFLGVSYRLDTSGKGNKSKARLLDGSVPVLSLSLTTAPKEHSVSDQVSQPSFFERSEPMSRAEEEMRPGLEISGEYSPDGSAISALSQRWGRFEQSVAGILACSSYVIGMEIPGLSALFSKIAVSFNESHPLATKMTYRASVLSFDQRFSQARMNVSISTGKRTIASGHLWSFMRPSLPEVEDSEFTGRSNALSGRVAVIVGASRGLGAAMKRAVELRGGVVYSIARSKPADTSTGVVTGDAGDTEFLKQVRRRVVKDRGRLDFLICNACPPILPLRLEENAADRIRAYISEAVSLTVAPLCSFLELLNENSGCAVIISSLAVEHPVKDWPHYLAAKEAVEMLARVASLQYPRIHTLIVRPTKLLTTLTNTPMGRVGAASPTRLADQIVRRLEGCVEPGKVDILTDAPF